MQEGFFFDAMEGAEGVIEQARRAQEHAQEDTPVVLELPEEIEQRAPGELDLELLEDAPFEVHEEYDPEGLLEAAQLSCVVLRWRTEFFAPGTDGLPDEDLNETYCWRAAQWEWVEDDDDSDEALGDDDWRLRAHGDVRVGELYELVPHVLREWVLRHSREGIELLRSLVEEDPRAFRPRLDRLAEEVRAIAPAGES